MTVTVTKSSTLYTWGGALFSWDSFTAQSKTWGTATIDDVAVDAAESATLAEKLARAAGKSIAETLSTAESFARQAGYKRAFAEAFALAETYTDQINFMINVSEALTLAEKLGKHTDMGAFAEAFALADAIAKGIGKGVPEQLALAEVYDRTVQFYVKLVESLPILEVLGKRTEMGAFEESFAVADHLGRHTNVVAAQTLALADGFARVASFKRNLKEGVGFTEALGKAIGLSPEEAFAIAEEYRRHANGVISDLLINADLDMDDTGFEQMLLKAAPPGYSDFRPFLAGDHEYQNALFRTILKGKDLDRPQLRGLALEVDVPDVFDRGTATTVTTGAVTVKFNRPFYVVPEVVVALKGGTVFAIPKIIGDIRPDGFDVQLEDSAGALVAGNVSWSAHGY